MAVSGTVRTHVPLHGGVRTPQGAVTRKHACGLGDRRLG